MGATLVPSPSLTSRRSRYRGDLDFRPTPVFVDGAVGWTLAPRWPDRPTRSELAFGGDFPVNRRLSFHLADRPRPKRFDFQRSWSQGQLAGESGRRRSGKEDDLPFGEAGAAPLRNRPGQRLDDQDAGMIGMPGKWPVKCGSLT